MRSILLTGQGYTLDQFRSLGDLGFNVIHRPEISVATLSELLPDLEAYVLGGNEHLDAAALDLAHHLRLISFVGTGYGAFVDVSAASARGIQVTNTPGIMAHAVAEHTIGLLLGVIRGLFAQNEAVKRSGVSHLTRELHGSTIGIVGMGAIGTLVARILANTFGCKIQYANRTRKPKLEVELRMSFTDIDTLFTNSDVVILLVAVATETIGLVDAKRLSIAKPGLILINTAGATLVDAIALKHALETRRIVAAAFDGYWIEPLPLTTNDPFGLLRLPDHQFVVTPHTAAKTVGTWDRMVAWAVNNVIEVLAEKNEVK
jgi:glyoxylate reductase